MSLLYKVGVDEGDKGSYQISFQQRNSDLERSLISHKRNNEQLGNHVNEQVNTMVQLDSKPVINYKIWGTSGAILSDILANRIR